MVNTKTFTVSTLPPPPSPHFFKWKGPKVWVLTTELLTARYQTVPFLTGWSSCALQFFMLCFRPNCISKVQWSIVVVFNCFSGVWGGGGSWPIPTELFVSSASIKETTEMAKKTIKPPAELLCDRRERSTTLGWQIFCGTDMKTTLTLVLEGLASQHDLRFADCVVPGWRQEW